MEFLKFERRDAMGILSFNRPDKLNALSLEVLDELEGFLREVEQDTSLRVLILRGEGRAFVAGADIRTMSGFQAEEAVAFARKGQRVFGLLEEMPQVVIAAVHGYALGGGMELAMACDIRVAERSAQFGQPEVHLGIIPGFAGTQRLPRLVGTGWARYLILTGRRISGEEAHRIGLVEVLADDGKALDMALEVAQDVLKGGPHAIPLAKRMILRGVDMPFPVAQAFEAETFAYLFTTGEPQEGMKAFLEKRRPSWTEKSS